MHRDRVGRGLTRGVLPAVVLLAGAVGLCIHQTRAVRREVARLSYDLADLADHVRVPERAATDSDTSALFRGPGAGTQAVLDLLAREAREAEPGPTQGHAQWGRRPA